MTAGARPLQDRVVLVTGAGGSGLGRVMAAGLAGRGARVMASDADEVRAEEAAAGARAAGGWCEALGLDVTDERSWAHAVGEILERCGRIDALVNNAGEAAFDVELHDLAAFDRVMAINARGTFLGLRAVIPEMTRLRRGVVVNIGSVAASVGLEHMHMAYGASKAAIRQMTRAAAVQAGPSGIRVVCVAPAMLTRRPLPPAGEAGFVHDVAAEAFPLRRYGRAEDVAAVVAFLLSDEAGHVTGTEIMVDGGYLAMGR